MIPKTDPVGADREARKFRRDLQRLSDTILLFLHAVDAAFMQDRTVPSEAGKKLARLVGQLDLANDVIRYSTLGIDYRRDNKVAAVAKLIRREKGRP